MTDRFFTDRQRAALYLAADGKCQRCGEELTVGWHSDHVKPHSAGGSTDVVNGQALCPPCNLKKGSTEMREWQNRATSKWEQHDRRDFLAVATPGAGKTRWALHIAHRERLHGSTDRIIVVVPRTELRTQWAKAASEHADLQLDPTWTPASGALPSGFNGVVVTYQAIAAAPQSFRHLCSVSTLLIADEIHHCGDDDTLRWGEALRTAFDPAVKRLLLSGTPFRSDSAPIPFVRYDDLPDGGRQAIPDYVYGYGQAVQDRVCRHIDFRTYDGQVRWLDVADCATADRRETLSPELRDKDRSRALATALDPAGLWMPGLLREADDALSVMREERPEAGGLVIAYRQDVARQYAAILEQATGEAPTVVLSDDDQASEGISEFRKARTRWLVAVDMVSEGVDIPRLSVAVLATQKRTEMFFRQAVGRVVRRQGLDDPHAVVFIPKVEPFVGFAQTLELEQLRVLEAARERAEKARAEAGPPTTFTVLGSDAPVYAGSVYAGEEFPADLVRAEEARLEAIGVPRQYAVQLLRSAREQAPAQATITIDPTPAPQPLYEYRQELRAALTREVGRAAARRGDHRNSKEIRGALYRTFSKPVSECSIDELERAISMVQAL